MPSLVSYHDEDANVMSFVASSHGCIGCKIVYQFQLVLSADTPSTIILSFMVSKKETDDTHNAKDLHTKLNA